MESDMSPLPHGAATVLLQVLRRPMLALTARRRADEASRLALQERMGVEAGLRGRVASLEAEAARRTDDLCHARADLEQAGLRLRELSSRVINAQEQERGHIARELHDETGQALTVIRMQLAELQQQGDADGTRIAGCIEMVNRATVHIRGVALSLRPPMLDDLGLADAIEWALGQHTAAAGWRGIFEGGEGDRRFPFAIETACFRIAQEALTNAARYSHASEVRVALKIVGQGLELTVTDNGQGFEFERFRSSEERKKHFGLLSMLDRATLADGRLHIDTGPGRGTRIQANFPLEA
jgi:signal transduction histidine kinase